jgi:hypothetical protein
LLVCCICRWQWGFLLLIKVNWSLWWSANVWVSVIFHIVDLLGCNSDMIWDARIILGIIKIF